MKLTTFSDYTLRVLIYLALEPDRLATIAQIATAYDISESHLTKVVHHLARGGWIESVRGRSGGIRLARDPASIRIGAVVRDAEGNGGIVECLSADGGCCAIAGNCKLAGILAGAVREFYAALDRHTLAELVVAQRPLRRTLMLAPRA